jgi:hypothetical protein
MNEAELHRLVRLSSRKLEALKKSLLHQAFGGAF